jgi:hypothetical protein
VANVIEPKQNGAGEAAQPSAGASNRKPWIRPYYELASLDETEAGPLGGPDLNSSVS